MGRGTAQHQGTARAHLMKPETPVLVSSLPAPCSRSLIHACMPTSMQSSVSPNTLLAMSPSCLPCLFQVMPGNLLVLSHIEGILPHVLHTEECPHSSYMLVKTTEGSSVSLRTPAAGSYPGQQPAGIDAWHL